jgi:hypothetical protein
VDVTDTGKHQGSLTEGEGTVHLTALNLPV